MRIGLSSARPLRARRDVSGARAGSRENVAGVPRTPREAETRARRTREAAAEERRAREDARRRRAAGVGLPTSRWRSRRRIRGGVDAARRARWRTTRRARARFAATKTRPRSRRRSRGARGPPWRRGAFFVPSARRLGTPPRPPAWRTSSSKRFDALLQPSRVDAYRSTEASSPPRAWRSTRPTARARCGGTPTEFAQHRRGPPPPRLRAARALNVALERPGAETFRDVRRRTSAWSATSRRTTTISANVGTNAYRIVLAATSNVRDRTSPLTTSHRARSFGTDFPVLFPRRRRCLPGAPPSEYTTVFIPPNGNVAVRHAPGALASRYCTRCACAWSPRRRRAGFRRRRTPARRPKPPRYTQHGTTAKGFPRSSAKSTIASVAWSVAPSTEGALGERALADTRTSRPRPSPNRSTAAAASRAERSAERGVDSVFSGSVSPASGRWTRRRRVAAGDWRRIVRVVVRLGTRFRVVPLHRARARLSRLEQLALARRRRRARAGRSRRRRSRDFFVLGARNRLRLDGSRRVMRRRVRHRITRVFVTAIVRVLVRARDRPGATTGRARGAVFPDASPPRRAPRASSRARQASRRRRSCSGAASARQWGVEDGGDDRRRAVPRSHRPELAHVRVQAHGARVALAPSPGRRRRLRSSNASSPAVRARHARARPGTLAEGLEHPAAEHRALRLVPATRPWRRAPNAGTGMRRGRGAGTEGARVFPGGSRLRVPALDACENAHASPNRHAPLLAKCFAHRPGAPRLRARVPLGIGRGRARTGRIVRHRPAARPADGPRERWKSARGRTMPGKTVFGGNKTAPLAAVAVARRATPPLYGVTGLSIILRVIARDRSCPPRTTRRLRAVLAHIGRRRRSTSRSPRPRTRAPARRVDPTERAGLREERLRVRDVSGRHTLPRRRRVPQGVRPRAHGGGPVRLTQHILHRVVREVEHQRQRRAVRVAGRVRDLRRRDGETGRLGNLALVGQVKVQDHVADLIVTGHGSRHLEHGVDVDVVKRRSRRRSKPPRELCVGGNKLQRGERAVVGEEQSHVGVGGASHVDHVVVGHEPAAHLGHREAARRSTPAHTPGRSPSGTPKTAAPSRRTGGAAPRPSGWHHLVRPRLGPDVAPHLQRGLVAHALVLEVRVHHAPPRFASRLLEFGARRDELRPRTARQRGPRQPPRGCRAPRRARARRRFEPGTRASHGEAAAGDARRGLLRSRGARGGCRGQRGWRAGRLAPGRITCRYSLVQLGAFVGGVGVTVARASAESGPRGRDGGGTRAYLVARRGRCDISVPCRAAQRCPRNRTLRRR